MKILIVAASGNDTRAYAMRRNPNDFKPTGYLREIMPDREKLTEVAEFLADNCPHVIAGYYPAFDHSKRVVCYNGRSEADQMRFEGKRNAENIIKCYDLENEPCKIQDWKFDVIRKDQSANEYLNAQAINMKRAGVTRICIGKSEFILR